MQLFLRNFKSHYCSGGDNLFYLIALSISVVTAVLYFINAMLYQYSVVWLHVDMLILVAACVLLFIIGVLLIERKPSLGRGLSTLAVVVVAGLLLLTFTGAIATTPYTLIDTALLASDRIFNFSIPAVLEWTHARPRWLMTLQLAYYSWTPQTVLLPLILGFTLQRKLLLRYLNFLGLTMLIGGMIYYFFPTTGPSSVLSSPYFPLEELRMREVYDAIHRGDDLKHMITGFVSMPSFHTVNGVVFILMLWRWLMSNLSSIWVVPVAVFGIIVNVLLITATMALGFHYVVDIIAGAVLAISCWFVLPYMEKKSEGVIFK